MRPLSKAFLAALLLVPTSVPAGAIYGTIRDGSNPVRFKPIEIACPDFRPGSFHVTAQTDNFGSFRFNLDQHGRCQLRMADVAPITIFASDSPIRYDFQVSRGANGLELRRQ